MPSIKSSIGNRNNISLDDACFLVTRKTIGKDDLGQSIIDEEPFMVFCSKMSITRAEFNLAGQMGIKPKMMFIVDSDSYDDEHKLEYHETRYTIYKTFQRVDGFTELYCEVNASD